MRYVEEFRSKKLITRLARRIEISAPRQPVNIMEVCGTHTHNFFRFGLDKVLPAGINLISGPGCPVCVSTQEYIDRSIAYARQRGLIIATFGDMLRVPGTESTLEKERANGSSIFTVYSPLDTLKLALANPSRKVVFLAVGFETTACAIALTVLAARREHINNIFFFTSLKLIPPAMDYLLRDKRVKVDGFLCPGHVSCIIGTKSYAFIPKRYKIGCCVAGFEPLDILTGIYLLVQQINRKRPQVANQYRRAVTENGNSRAQSTIREAFRVYDATWRGLGRIAGSGLILKEGLRRFDIETEVPLKIKFRLSPAGKEGCRCADVLKGLIQPPQCLFFRKACTPETPLGGCMVSAEGACHAYFRYHQSEL
ncbi:MAG: hydrogenase formation protein HypD [Candidatus Omnitrophota bacterium]|jgi:hydrogenase expression/formation protein HypD